MNGSTLLAPVLCSAVLAACGGGGGGGDAAPARFASSINSNNAMEVAAHGYSSFEALNDQTSSGSSMIAGMQADEQRGDRGVLGGSLNLLYKGLDSQPLGSLAADMAAADTVSDTLPCPNGGTVSRTLDFSDPNRVSNGDRMTITANNCNDEGVTFNGTVTYTFNNLSGTIGSNSAWSATLALTYSNFSIAYNGDAIRTNGDLTLAYSQNGYGMANASASGNSLQLTLLENNVVVVDRRLEAYDYSGELNGSSITYAANYTVSGNFPKLGNATYTVATITPFQMTLGYPPSAGVLTVTATDNTSLRLTAIDTVNVRLEIDQNGDSVTDEVINTTWSDLENRI
jgi:hypothetical protein